MAARFLKNLYSFSIRRLKVFLKNPTSWLSADMSVAINAWRSSPGWEIDPWSPLSTMKSSVALKSSKFWAMTSLVSSTCTSFKVRARTVETTVVSWSFCLIFDTMKTIASVVNFLMKAFLTLISDVRKALMKRTGFLRMSFIRYFKALAKTLNPTSTELTSTTLMVEETAGMILLMNRSSISLPQSRTRAMSSLEQMGWKYLSVYCSSIFSKRYSLFNKMMGSD